jgi:hypothetical protein
MVYYLIRSASWLAGKVPRRARLAIAGSVTILMYYGWVSKRRVIMENVACIVGNFTRDSSASRLERISWRHCYRDVYEFV